MHDCFRMISRCNGEWDRTHQVHQKYYIYRTGCGTIRKFIALGKCLAMELTPWRLGPAKLWPVYTLISYRWQALLCYVEFELSSQALQYSSQPAALYLCHDPP